MRSREDEWFRVKTEVIVGSCADCIVTRHCEFGVIVHLVDYDVWGVMERIVMERDGIPTPEAYPAIGQKISAPVIGFRESMQQVELRLPKLPPSANRNYYSQVDIRLAGRDAGGAILSGLQEVNSAVTSGRKVTRLKAGSGLFLKVGEGADSVRIRFNGFSVVFVTEDSKGCDVTGKSRES